MYTFFFTKKRKKDLVLAVLDPRCFAQAFLSLGQVEATLRYGVQASHCSGFWLQSTGSRCVGFSSCTVGSAVAASQL